MRDPEKVRRLKLGLPQWGGDGQEEGGGQQSNGRNGEADHVSQLREDWSPINKRRRDLDWAASDLDINPAAPAAHGQGAQGQQQGGGGVQHWGDDGEWEGVGEGEQQRQERAPQWPRGPSWEGQLSSTWSGRRGVGPPGFLQGRSNQQGWPGAS